MPTMPSVTRWESAVQYRWKCEGGCETENAWVAVIRRKGKSDLRLCRTCYQDGFWKKAA